MWQFYRSKFGFQLVLLLIVFLALFLRTVWIPKLTKFGYDEARDATVEKNILGGKFTLLGPETRIGDKIIYFGPLHFYLMAPALKIAEFDPLGPNYLTALLGALTVVPLYFLSKGLLAPLFYAVFPLAIIYNRWAWNPNTIPLFTSLFLLAFLKKHYVLAGIFLGLTIQLHITSVALLVLTVAYLIYKKVLSRSIILKIFFGLIIGLIPLIIFDLRHHFLYLSGYLGLFGVNSSYRGFNWHYFLWLLPLLAISISKIPKTIIILIIVISLSGSLFWLVTEKPNLAQNPQTIQKISKIISKDQKGQTNNFNVVSLVDLDTRATAYRYFLSLDNLTPLEVNQYSVADHLYVTTFVGGQKLLYNQTYEIKSFGPNRYTLLARIGQEKLYRLDKTR